MCPNKIQLSSVFVTWLYPVSSVYTFCLPTLLPTVSRLCGTYLHWFFLTKSGRHRPKLFMRTAPKFPLERTSQGVYLWVPPQYLWCACQCLSGHQQRTGRFRMDLVRGWSWGTMRNCLNGYPFAPMDILCLPHRSCPVIFVHCDQQSF